MSFSKEYSESIPANSESVGSGASRIRDTKTIFRERLAVDHNFKADETDDDDIGKHKQVSLIEKTAHPANPTAGIILYDKEEKLYQLKKTGDPIEVIDETDQAVKGVKTFESVPLIPIEDPDDDGDDEDENPKAVSKAYLKAYVVATEFGERMIMADIKTSGTNGGTFTSGAWQVRELNTVNHNSITGASLLSNRFTLPAGTYHVQASAPAYSDGEHVSFHKAILYDVTHSATLLIGTSERLLSINEDSNRSFIDGVITLTEETAMEIRHRCSVSMGTTGFGAACSFGVSEVYTQVSIVKIG